MVSAVWVETNEYTSQGRVFDDDRHWKSEAMFRVESGSSMKLACSTFAVLALLTASGKIF
jgi:hypothetical protein